MLVSKNKNWNRYNCGQSVLVLCVLCVCVVSVVCPGSCVVCRLLCVVRRVVCVREVVRNLARLNRFFPVTRSLSVVTTPWTSPIELAAILWAE